MKSTSGVTCIISSIVLTLVGAYPAEAARRDLSPPGVISPLTAPQDGNPVDLALAFVREKVEELGLTTADLDELQLVDSYRTKHNGITHVYLRQRTGGIPVWNGDIAIHVGAGGSILKLNSQFAHNLAESVNTLVPILTAPEAVAAASAHLGLALDRQLVVVEETAGPTRAVVFDPAGIALEPIRVGLMLFEKAEGEVRLVWNVILYELSAENSWDLLIDAVTSELLMQNNWVDRESYRAYELPVRSPVHTTPASPR